MADISLDDLIKKDREQHKANKTAKVTHRFILRNLRRTNRPRRTSRVAMIEIRANQDVRRVIPVPSRRSSSRRTSISPSISRENRSLNSSIHPNSSNPNRPSRNRTPKTRRNSSGRLR